MSTDACSLRELNDVGVSVTATLPPPPCWLLPRLLLLLLLLAAEVFMKTRAAVAPAAAGNCALSARQHVLATRASARKQTHTHRDAAGASAAAGPSAVADGWREWWGAAPAQPRAGLV
jgi:hypothetical protein